MKSKKFHVRADCLSQHAIGAAKVVLPDRKTFCYVKHHEGRLKQANTVNKTGSQGQVLETPCYDCGRFSMSAYGRSLLR